MIDFHGYTDFHPPVETTVLVDALNQYNRARQIYRCYAAGVFAAVPEEFCSLETIAGKAGFRADRLELVLNMLESFNLMEKSGAEYRLNEEARTFLHTNSPYFMGDYLKMQMADEEENGAIMRNWLKGISTRNDHNPEKIFSNFFIYAMAQDSLFHNSVYETTKLIGDHPGFAGKKRLLDVGGGHGLFAIALKKRNPDLEIGVFDLPQNETVAMEYADGCGEELTFYPGNFYINDLPGEQDVVLCSDIMYPMSAEKRTAVFKKVYDALKPGGRFFLKLWYLNEDRTGCQWITSLAARVRMQNDESYVFTLNEACHVLENLGFVTEEILSPGENSWKIISAVKK